MILKDRPESVYLPLPSDNLSRKDRLSRLFSGNDNQWRLLAVLTLVSGPSDLIKPEIVHLVRRYGPAGLMVRLVFIGTEDITLLERELAFWKEEYIQVTGDNIHARRFLNMESDCLPCIKLFSPEGSLKVCHSGFDTEEGLDALCRILTEELNIDACNSNKRNTNTDSVILNNH